MPVVGTPVTPSVTAGQVTCADQAVVIPKIATVFGCEVKGRRRAVETTQGLAPTISWVMLNPAGNPVDLETCGNFDGDDGSSIRLRLRETVYSSAANTIFEFEGVVSSVSEGVVQFSITPDVTAVPGIYLAEATVRNTDGDPIFSNLFHLVVNRGLSGTQVCVNGPPSIAEIRLHMRDSDPSESSLLDTLQFDVAEISMAIEYPVLYWNESLPPINQTYSTNTYPFRFYWLEAIVGRLYMSAAHWYRRNALPYNAGGVAVNDMDKADDYEKIGQQKWEEYKDFVLRKKVQFNCDAAITVQGSGYSGFFGSYY